MKLVYTDVNHSYWLNGKRVKSASKVAKIAADGFALELYAKRQIAIGMTLDKTLAEDVAVDIYNKDKINEVCERAEFAAKSHARANRGTQRHRVFELLLLDQENRFITDQQRADAEVLRRTMDAYGLERPAPHLVEGFVAYPDFGVVGRYDAALPYQGRHAIFDLKSGVNAVRYPHATCVQLALYRFAPHISASIERDGDRSTVTEWTTFPDDIDDEVGYVIHCDDDHEVGELWRIDLRHGKLGADLALSIVDWRKQHNYGKDAADKIESGAITRSETLPISAPPTPTRESLLERYQQLDDNAKERFVGLQIAKDDLAAIDAALTELENPPTVIDLARERMQRDAARTAKQLETQSLSSSDDEGGPASEADVNTVAAFALIEPERAAWCGEIVKQGIAAGHDFRVSMKATQRRADLCIAVGLWAQGKYWDPADDEPLRAAIYAAIGDESAFWPTLTPGEIVGQIDAAGARTLRAVMNHIDQDELVAVADEDTKTLRWQTRRPVA